MKIIPTYEIWRVQDFHDLDKQDIIYRKINTIPSKHFKEDKHVSYEEAKKEADRYIEYINSVKGTFTPIAHYLDKLYIIKNTNNIEKYYGDEYYNMRYLLSDYEKKNKNKNKYNYKLCSICVLVLLACLIFQYIIHDTNTKINIRAITEINEFRNCIFSKWKDTECRVDINNYTFNLTNCHYDNNFWDFCECCPKATLFGKKLKNSFCPHEGVFNLTSRYGNFTAKCGSEFFQPNHK
jgi:hypothetical protein